MTLQEFFRDNPKIAVAFSGGVDSTYLLWAAVRAGAQVKAYYVRSAFQPRFEYEDALLMSQLFDLFVELIQVTFRDGI